MKTSHLSGIAFDGTGSEALGLHISEEGRFREAERYCHTDASFVRKVKAIEPAVVTGEAGNFSKSQEGFEAWYLAAVGISTQEASQRAVYDLNTLRSCWNASGLFHVNDHHLTLAEKMAAKEGKS